MKKYWCKRNKSFGRGFDRRSSKFKWQIKTSTDFYAVKGIMEIF